jgi:hypothetical protein
MMISGRITPARSARTATLVSWHFQQLEGLVSHVDLAEASVITRSAQVLAPGDHAASYEMSLAAAEPADDHATDADLLGAPPGGKQLPPTRSGPGAPP